MASEQTITDENPEEPRFRIGAVSRLTQIPVDTLRAWERRYAVVSPARTESAARLYAESDVERLKLIKQLVGNGHAISSVAGLPRADLETLLAHHQTSNAAAAQSSFEVDTVISYGDSVAPLDVEKAERAGLTVLAQLRSWSAFEQAVLESAPDALVVEMSALVRERVDNLLRLAHRCGAAHVIVVYGFAPAHLLDDLVAESITTLRAPVNHEQLMRELRRPRAPATRIVDGEVQTIPERLFDDASLAELAKLPAVVKCECPHHLVDIIRTLTQFEYYSSECENQDNEDAALHGRLRATTAQARALFERALIEVAEYEGIELPDRVRGRG
ncbi:MAG: MerR family transcriptional regulator [Gammaproteobacteria bacterium]